MRKSRVGVFAMTANTCTPRWEQAMSKGYWEPLEITVYGEYQRAVVSCVFTSWPCLLPRDDPKHEEHKQGVPLETVGNELCLPYAWFKMRICLRCGHSPEEEV